ncbi:hypothetical protein WH87_09990 [Devosia epidermidihirudinis]|uniref:Uncharacterized protein n=1 Tax=Devosia epidermidihirudinis TaxID=1293439 RepID=A0A0F5QAH7_9HYPH|nr:hypothetical protein [Devosia epidermidihirudinis]KKC37970.1 hypothetical protein WH87_09990 [Devosia epidermidihirudinis]
MRNLDFSSWEGIVTTVLGLALFTLIGVGIRIVMMLTIQQRQQRMNRQINERLKTLIAAYKVLGGSFTGRLSVDPSHLRDITRRQAELALEAHEEDETEGGEVAEATGHEPPASALERARRIRDAVEAALSDIVLLGTEEHVRLAAQAANDLAAGKPIRTAELVISLRNYVRKALDLDPIPADANIPLQGPTRPQSAAGGGRGKGSNEAGGSGGGGGGGMGGGMGGGGMGMGLGLGGRRDDDTTR